MSSSLALGVDIGGTKIAAGVVEEDGNILAMEKVPTPETPEGIEEAIAGLYQRLSQKYDIDHVGLAAAGFVSSDRKTVMFAPNIDWRDHPLGGRVMALIDGNVDVVVENDANAAGWGEYRFGNSAGGNMLMLTIGTGVGGAVIVDGNLLRGASGAGAEVGHMRLVDGGERCGCGLRGCFEAYGSGNALERIAAERVQAALPGATVLEISKKTHRVPGPSISEAALDGDLVAIGAIKELGEWIGKGAASAAALLDPDTIVVGGGVAAVGDLLFDSIRTSYEDNLTGAGHRSVARIVAARLANDAGIVGAADLARRATPSPA